MRDPHVPPHDIEVAAKLIDPDAWASSDNEADAFSLRYRRYEAREKAGWHNEYWPRPMAMKLRTRSA